MISKGHDSIGWRMRGGVLAAVGVALAVASVPASAEGGPSLGSARSFAVLASANVSSTGLTAVTGDVGVSPGTEITGFGPGTVTGGSIHAGDATAATAHADASIAYAFLEGMASIPANNLTDTDLGGLTLEPGVYKFNSSAGLTGALVLDAMGDSDALFVVQVASSLTTASSASVTVIHGGANYDESRIFWQVGSSATLGSGTAFKGNILAYSSITLVTGSTMVGNALALNGAVTLDANSVVSPTLVIPPPPSGIAAPVGLTAVLSGLPVSQGADLSWTDKSDNETEFRVYRRDGASPAFLQIDTVVAADMVGTDAVVTYQDPALTPSKIYAYRVTAFNAADGESDPSNVDQVHTGPGVPLARPSGARVNLTPPDGAPDDDASARLFVKHFPAIRARAERSWFKLKLRHLESATVYTLWADDPSTAGAALVQFDSFTTRNSGNYNHTMDTKKGDALPFGATLAALSGMAVEVRDSAGTTTLLAGIIPTTSP